MSITSRRKIIVDVDAGSDDGIALLMLLAAHKRQDIDLLAITCVSGNTHVDNVAVNVLRILEVLDHLHIPVFKGAAKALLPIDVLNSKEDSFHGRDGFGDILESKPDTSIIQEEHAVNALYRIVSQFPGEVTVMPVGPLTNIALAMKMYSDFSEKVKSIYIMGGNYKGVGNMTNSAEFNFVIDPEAAHIVLEGNRSPCVIVPWETCLDTGITQTWRFEVMGILNTPQIQLMNTVENAIYTRNPQTRYLPCDAACAAVFLNPEVISDSFTTHGTVELHGLYARGQVIIDHTKTRVPNAVIVTKINDDILKKMLLWAAGHQNPGI